MTGPLLNQIEAEKYRDRMLSDELKATETLSNISRSLATGLALIVYVFFFGKDPIPFVSRHLDLLLYASLCGVLALLADGGQYIAAVFQVRGVRRFMKANFATAHRVTLAELDAVRNEGFGRARDFLFWLKLCLVGIGSSIVLAVLVRAIMNVHGVQP